MADPPRIQPHQPHRYDAQPAEVSPTPTRGIVSSTLRTTASIALGMVDAVPGMANSLANVVTVPVARALGSDFRFRTENVISGIVTSDPEILRGARSAQFGTELGVFVVSLGTRPPLGVGTRAPPIRPAAPAPAPAVVPSTAVRPVGSILGTALDVMANPQLLAGRNLHEVRLMIGRTPGWTHGVMTRSRFHLGWTFRETNAAGNLTGRMIQYHPGSSRHFRGAPYWKVSGVPDQPPIRIPAAAAP